MTACISSIWNFGICGIRTRAVVLLSCPHSTKRFTRYSSSLHLFAVINLTLFKYILYVHTVQTSVTVCLLCHFLHILNCCAHFCIAFCMISIVMCSKSLHLSAHIHLILSIAQYTKFLVHLKDWQIVIIKAGRREDVQNVHFTSCQTKTFFSPQEN